MFSRFSLALCLLARTANAIDNGLGKTPPRGWWSWNQFQKNINQDTVIANYHAMLSKKREVHGRPTSLHELGYTYAGIDDGWQACNSGPDNIGYHTEIGIPVVNKSVYPDLKLMTSTAKNLGLHPGWYGNNCDCYETSETCNNTDACFEGDVYALSHYGFESIKLDGCGVTHNVSKYAALINQSGHQMLIENCHNSGTPVVPGIDTPLLDATTGEVNCPYNFYRVSEDIRPTYGSVLLNLNATRHYSESKLSFPGCWAYPDMLEVGVTNSQGTKQECPHQGTPGCTLSITEMRSHFYAWCIVSAPLMLGFDLTNEKMMDHVWPFISNREALEINAAWAGEAGHQVKEAGHTVHFKNCSWGQAQCDHPVWTMWKKALPHGKVAVLVMNNGERYEDIKIHWHDIGIECEHQICAVRDIHHERSLGGYEHFYEAKEIHPHDTHFIVVEPIIATPSYETETS